jgi:hypothetical protein
MNKMLILIVLWYGSTISSNKAQHNFHHVYHYLISKTFHFDHSDFPLILQKRLQCTLLGETK